MKIKMVMIALMCAALSATSYGVEIDFDALAHGRIVNSQFSVSDGLTISAVNLGTSANGNHPNIAIAFDSNFGGATTDGDLIAPWVGGNLPSSTDLGVLLIIAENDFGGGDGIVDDPDDEAGRPAGSLFFDFATPIYSFGLDLADIEGLSSGAEPGNLVFVSGASQVIVPFSTLVGRDGASWGNNSANAIAPFTLAELGIGAIDQVEVQLGGSGAVGGIRFDVPEAGATAVFGLIAAAGLAGLRRKLHG